MVGFYNYTVILTYMSLVSSITGMFFTFTGHLSIGILCLALSGLFDAFDGKVARSKKDRTMDEKRFGIQIDSLCDLVSFWSFSCCIVLVFRNEHAVWNGYSCTVLSGWNDKTCIL